MHQHVKDLCAKQPESFTERYGLSTGPVPVDSYRNQEFYEQEREKVFRRSWLMLGRIEEIPNPRDYVLKDVEVLSASLIVSRQMDGSVRTFHNVCPHRGNQILIAPKGSAGKFSCPYHKWTFTSAGDLLAIPDESSFFNVDKAKCGLKEVHTQLWEGWIFVNLSEEPEISLEGFLGPLGDYLTGLPYLNTDHQIVISTTLECNWKVAADAFSEAYHIPAIHARTIGETFSSNDNPFAHVLDAKILGPHRSVSLYGNPSHVPGKDHVVERLSTSGSDIGSVIATGSAKSMREFLGHRAVNPTRSADWAMDINHIFPNSQIDTGPGGFWIQQYWPLSYNRCRYEGRFHIPRAENAEQRFQQELFVARVVEVWLEDLSNVARVQKGLESGAFSTMQLQDNELLIRHSVEQVEKWVAAKTVRDALGIQERGA